MQNRPSNPTVEIVVLVFFSVIVLMILLIPVIHMLKKLYLRQRFNEYGSGLHHLGFKGKEPFDKLGMILIASKPVFDMKLYEWRYLIYDTDDKIRAVLGVDAFDKVVFVGATLISKFPVVADIIGRIPHYERETDGYFSILLRKHNDQIINFYCPFYRLYHNLELPAKALVRLSILPIFVRVFEEESQIKKFQLLRAKDSPEAITGHSRVVFDILDFLGRGSSSARPTIYACGEVVGYKKAVNRYTKKTFHVTTIDVGSAFIDIYSRRRAYWRLPRKGEFIAVDGQLTGYIERILD